MLTCPASLLYGHRRGLGDHLYRDACRHSPANFAHAGDRNKDTCRNNRNVDSRCSSFRTLQLKRGKWRREDCQDKQRIPLERWQE